MRNLKLGAKISLGFGLLLALAIALGGMAVYNMTGAEDRAERLDKQYVTEVGIVAQLERRIQRMMFNMRGYTMSEDKKYLEPAYKDLEGVKENLKQGKELADKHPALVKLREGVDKSSARVADYDKLTKQTIEKNDALGALRHKMDQAAASYMNECNAYLDSQNKGMERDFGSGAEVANLKERLTKITLINEIINQGNAVRVGNFKAQGTNDPKLMQEIIGKFAAISQKMAAIEPLTHQADNQQQLKAIRQAAEAYHGAMQDYLANWTAREEIGAKRAGVADEILALARATSIAGLEGMRKISTETYTSLAAANLAMLIGLAGALVAGILLALFITRSITKPIHGVIAGLNEGSLQVASASGQVANASQSLAEGAAQQAAALEETSSSLEEMASMTRQNAENADQADNLAKDTTSVVSKANHAMGELTTSISEMSKASEETGKIIKTIDEIAFQTNLLALNAAVEAARAGEAGAGFAVVAEEVRNLAMRAAEAAKNTSTLIEQTIKKTKDGAEIVRRTNEAFQEVQNSAGRMGELVAEIAAASREQAQGIDQVNKAATEMDKVTQQNAANAEESAAAAEELSAQSETMQGFVNELIGLVGTSNGNGHAKTKHRLAAPKTRALPGGSLSEPAKAPLHLAARKANPSQVIPLEDGDFKDF